MTVRIFEIVEGPAAVDTVPVEIEFIRRLRNDMRERLTRAGEFITEEAQQVWWASDERKIRRITVASSTKALVGFGMVKPDHLFGWLTGAVSVNAQRQGIGHLIFKDMIDWCDRRGLAPWLEVFVDNTPALRLYEKLGFRIETSRILEPKAPDSIQRVILVMSRYER